MTDNKVTITVEYITCYCPHCNEEIKILYSDFLSMMPEDPSVLIPEDYRDWIGENFNVLNVGKK